MSDQIHQMDHQKLELNACFLVMYVNCNLTGQMWSISLWALQCTLEWITLEPVQCRILLFFAAEKEGFEPPDPWLQINGFQDRRIRPLCHFSLSAAKIIFFCFLRIFFEIIYVSIIYINNIYIFINRM